MRYAYPCRPQPGKTPGSFTITFRDITEAFTQGDSLGEALENAQEALELALTGRIEDRKEIPEPTNPETGEELVPLTPPFAAKTALLLEMRRQHIQPEELRRRMGITPKAVQYLLSPARISEVNRLTQALQAVGRRIILEDLPDDTGEHFREPAALNPMEDTQFMRRLRRYAAHHGMEWVLLDYSPDNGSNVRLGTKTARFPDGMLSQQDLADILEQLGVDAREF